MVTDGTQTKTDTKLSSGKAETPKETPTFSQEQVDKMLRDRETSIKADIGRQKAEADKALKAAQAAQKRVDEMLRRQEEAELEANKDDPAELRRIRAEQARKKAESESAEVKAQLDDANARLAEREAKDRERDKENTARDIATRLQVDPVRLAKLAKYTDGSVEAIEEVAQDLPKLNPNPPPGGGFRPDSNRSHGGGTRTKYEIMQDFNSGNISNVQYEEQLKAIGEKP